MLFNSYAFIFLFLPITLSIYFVLNKWKLIRASIFWLILVSLVYYGCWNPKYVLLIVGIVLFNYTMGTLLRRNREAGRPQRKFLLITGISVNLLLLGYFKYADFFISNFNSLSHSQVPLLHIALPVGISFFTFTQIAYLVDAHRGEAEGYSLPIYALFVSFFPYLLSGPIIHHREITTQYHQLRNKVLDYRNITAGLYLFFIGLFKKVVIADSFSGWVGNGFDHASTRGSFPFRIRFNSISTSPVIRIWPSGMPGCLTSTCRSTLIARTALSIFRNSGEGGTSRWEGL